MEAGREAENGEHDCGPNSRTLSFSQNLTYGTGFSNGTGFSKTLLRRKNIVKRGQHASRWSATRMAKKLGKNLSSPLTEAGLLMEDAEESILLRLLVVSVAEPASCNLSHTASISSAATASFRIALLPSGHPF